MSTHCRRHGSPRPVISLEEPPDKYVGALHEAVHSLSAEHNPDPRWAAPLRRVLPCIYLAQRVSLRLCFLVLLFSWSHSLSLCPTLPPVAFGKNVPRHIANVEPMASEREW